MSNLTKAQIKAMASRLGQEPDTSIANVLIDAFAPKTDSTAPATVKIPALTEEHREALRLLPEVYARVTPTEPRRLTQAELEALVTEREVLDLIEALVTSRKKNSLREHLANHMDRVAETKGLAAEGSVTDDKGHYYVKDEEPVPGTGRKVQKIVSDPKAQVSSAKLLEMYEAGDLTREEYLALTTQPTTRVFDETKARKAIKKNPGLLTKLAQATVRPDPTVTIKVAVDKG